MPYLDRDEPKLYLWMFFNCWVSCYREELNGMIEHPAPVLGFSNSAVFKTSDEANAMMWLRYMFVYCNHETLYLGRAIPRAWFRDGEEIGAKGVVTRFGEVNVAYKSMANSKTITMSATLPGRRTPGRIVARIRHPEGLPIRSIRVKGKRHQAYDRNTGDIDLTGLKGKVVVEARY
jgi:hypothetical protein